MTQEKERILKMLEEGKISVDECKSLLTAVGEDKGATEPTKIKPWWIIMAVVAGILLLSGGLGSGKTEHVGPFHFQLNGFLSPTTILLLFLTGLCFWIAALFNCIQRKDSDFPRLFVEDGKYDKLIWLGVLLAGSVVGAAAYVVIVVWNGRPHAADDGAYATPPRAASLRWLFCTFLALSLVTAAIRL